MRKDVDIVSLNDFFAHLESSKTWPTNLVDNDSAFRRLLELENIFLSNIKAFNETPATNFNFSDDISDDKLKSVDMEISANVLNDDSLKSSTW